MFFRRQSAEMKRIRDNYQRVKKLRYTKSGQAVSKFKPIRYERELEFLNPNIANGEMILMNITSVSENDEGEHSEQQQH